MAALLVPGIQHRLLSGKSTTPLDPRFIVVHTMVGYMAGTEALFTPSGRPYSHFGAGGSGEIRQWQDLRYRAASDRDGNPYSISIECEDHGPPFPAWSRSDVPRFTDAQADSLVVLLSWLCHRFGLPKKAIGTSCPSERGIGWHRLGIDPWRYPTCLKWSSSRGKACPGDNRIAQLRNDIIPRVSAPEDDMPTIAEINEAAKTGQLDDFFKRSGQILRDVTQLARADQVSGVGDLIRDVGRRIDELTELLAPWAPEHFNRAGELGTAGEPGMVQGLPQDRWLIEVTRKVRELHAALPPPEPES